MVIAVDFDGTIVHNAYPEIGEPKWGVVEALKASQAKGNTIILWTCRDGQLLHDAVTFCKNVLDLTFDKINSDSDAALQAYSTRPRKIGADLYVDDRAISPCMFELMVLGEG